MTIINNNDLVQLVLKEITHCTPLASQKRIFVSNLTIMTPIIREWFLASFSLDQKVANYYITRIRA
jgi:hypothetical protein